MRGARGHIHALVHADDEFVGEEIGGVKQLVGDRVDGGKVELEESGGAGACVGLEDARMDGCTYGKVDRSMHAWRRDENIAGKRESFLLRDEGKMIAEPRS